MKYIILALTSLLSFSLKAQFGTLKPDMIERYKNMTMCVVLFDNDTTTYNADIKAAVEKFWKFSKYEFISEEEFLEKMNQEYTFLKPSIHRAESSVGGGGFTITAISAYNSLDFFEGDTEMSKKNYELHKKRGSYYYSPYKLNHAKIAIQPMPHYENYSFEMPLYIKMLQSFLQRVEKGKSMGKLAKPASKFIHEDVDFNTKELIINEEFLAEFINEEDVKAHYPYKFSFQSPESISKMIDDGTKGKLYLFTGNSGVTWGEFMLVSIDDGFAYRYFYEIGFWSFYYKEKDKYKENGKNMLLKALGKAVK